LNFKILSEKMETILGLDSPPSLWKTVKQEANHHKKNGKRDKG